MIHEEMDDIDFWKDRCRKLNFECGQLNKAFDTAVAGLKEISETDFIRNTDIKYIAKDTLKKIESIISIWKRNLIFMT